MRAGGFEFSPGLVPSLLTAALLGLLVGLGFWQLARAREKEALIGTFERRTREPAVEIDGSRPLPARIEFQAVSARGAYDAEHQFLLDNRTHRGRAGFDVLTPLRLDPHTGVLVDRGWIPLGERRDVLPALPVESTARWGSGEVGQVDGIALLPHEHQLVLGDTGYGSHRWPRIVQRIELSRMESALGYRLLGIVLALSPQSADGFVREWVPHAGITPVRHRGYALQWFALALALVAIYVLVNTRRMGPPPSGPGGGE